jgi:hypothetical protein
MSWILANWETLVAALFAVLTAASFITGLLPTPRAHEFILRLLAWLSFLKPRTAPGTLRVPFTPVDPDEPLVVDRAKAEEPSEDPTTRPRL